MKKLLSVLLISVLGFTACKSAPKETVTEGPAQMDVMDDQASASQSNLMEDEQPAVEKAAPKKKKKTRRSKSKARASN